MVIFTRLEGAGARTKFPQLLRRSPPHLCRASHYLGVRHALSPPMLLPHRYNMGVPPGHPKVPCGLLMVCPAPLLAPPHTLTVSWSNWHGEVDFLSLRRGMWHPEVWVTGPRPQSRDTLGAGHHSADAKSRVYSTRWWFPCFRAHKNSYAKCKLQCWYSEVGPLGGN